jgi:hypothetical protein
MPELEAASHCARLDTWRRQNEVDGEIIAGAGVIPYFAVNHENDTTNEGDCSQRHDKRLCEL